MNQYAMCIVDPHLCDWGIELRSDFHTFSANTVYNNETHTIFGRQILAIEGIPKETVNQRSAYNSENDSVNTILNDWNACNCTADASQKILFHQNLIP